ncbi:MAG: lactate racemase domain-containing protein [Bacteroidota bacterium]
MMQIEYGPTQLPLPAHVPLVERGMKPAPQAIDGRVAIPEALARPIQSPPLSELARRAFIERPDGEAVIVVSDHTRPVPYRGEGGFILHLVQTLLAAGWSAGQIVILIGAGSHRNMEADEIEQMLGLQASGIEGVIVENHEYENPEHLVFLGHTHRNSEVFINRRYHHAALKIVTGLVESHFMAGASGGRKGICPGIVGKQTLSIFHGAALLRSPEAADLVLEGNPLHDEALEVALMTGCDFLLNATIDEAKQLNGVFAGDLQAAHQAAVRFIREYVEVELPHRYPIVLVPAGFVGVNHYQAGKSAVEAARAVEAGGWIIVVAKHTEPDPIGGHGYKESLALLREHGVQGFVDLISAPDWTMVQEQWQVQMWCKVLTQLGDPRQLIYCNLDIPPDAQIDLPGVMGLDLLSEADRQGSETEVMTRMIAAALQHAKAHATDPEAEILFLKDGPYGIPQVQAS